MRGAKLPPPIEEAGVTPYDLDDYNKPLVFLGHPRPDHRRDEWHRSILSSLRAW